MNYFKQMLLVSLLLLLMLEGVTAPDTATKIMEKMLCGYPLEEGSINFGDGYATNLEVFLGCVLQWVILIGVYKYRHKKWPAFLFKKQNDAITPKPNATPGTEYV